MSDKEMSEMMRYAMVVPRSILDSIRAETATGALEIELDDDAQFYMVNGHQVRFDGGAWYVDGEPVSVRCVCDVE